MVKSKKDVQEYYHRYYIRHRNKYHERYLQHKNEMNAYSHRYWCKHRSKLIKAEHVRYNRYRLANRQSLHDVQSLLK